MLVKFHDHPSKNDAWIRNRSCRRRQLVEDDVWRRRQGVWRLRRIFTALSLVEVDSKLMFKKL